MTTYKCKCGVLQRKSTNADNTGNRDTEHCQGCPYLLPWGEYGYIKGEGVQLKVKGYECRMSQDLEYGSRFAGSVTDKCTCSVVSLDYEFLQQISDWIRATYPNGELSGGFSRERIRATDFSSNGRYRYSICCSKNRAGMAAKAALLERFFYPDGSRKDMTPQEEEAKILADIKNGRKAAQESAGPGSAPAENEVYVSPAGARYRIGQIPFGKTTYWRTEILKDEKWTPVNTSVYPELENAQGEFAAWIRSRSLVPEETAMQQAAPVSSHVALAAVSGVLPAESAESAPGPVFDYSGLDERTVEYLHIAEREYAQGKVWAERGLRRMADGVAIAHEALCTTVATQCRNGQGAFAKSETSFGAWCEGIGISRKSAERLLQVSALYDKSSPNQQKVLEELSPSLLYAAARPSAPAELVEQVKSGDITTHKQYQALLAEKKAAEKQVNILKNQNEYLQKVCEDEIERAETAEKDNAALKETADLAKTETALARASEETMRSQYTQLLDEQNEHLARIAELEARPIETTAVQPPSAEQLAAIRQQADEEARQKYYPLVEQASAARREVQARADALSAQLRQLQREARMPGIDTVYPMCCDYARSISTFQSTFLMVGAGLDRKEFEDCAHELMDAADALCCTLQAAMDERGQTTQKEDDPFA